MSRLADRLPWRGKKVASFNDENDYDDEPNPWSSIDLVVAFIRAVGK